MEVDGALYEDTQSGGHIDITTNIPALTEAAGDLRQTSVENLLLLARIFDLDMNNFTLFNIFWKFYF